MASRDIDTKSGSYTISYDIKNPTKEKTILFLHGWGSNKEIMQQAFAKELRSHKHIYVDMPGFGNSSINQPIYTKEYASVMQEFLNALHVKVDIVVGHSFGGKVATLLNPKVLVLLSSAGIVVPKSLRVKTKIKFFKLFKNVVPKGMYKFFATSDVKGMSQTMYEVLKGVVDEDFSEIFASSDSKALLFWGKEDTATPLSSGEKIASLIRGSKFYPCEGDHFFFLQNAKFIGEKIDENV